MTKIVRYDQLKMELTAVLEGELNQIARYSTFTCMLSQAFKPRFFWTGIYLVDPLNPNELVIGPYQGTLGCLRIPFGKGVCGTAAAKQESVLVPNVHEFPSHIACDSKSNSEVVVPLFNESKNLLGVLDIDSEQFNAFDNIDVNNLESLSAIVTQY